MKNSLFSEIIAWSEVWAVAIPLTVLLFHPKQSALVRPVIVYLWIAFFINLAGDIIVDFKRYLPSWLHSNNPLYNIHSVVRFTCFSYFFITLRQPSFTTVRKVLPYVSLLFLVINFGFFEDFFYKEHLSGNLLSAEAYLLLVYCMFYYLSQLNDEVAVITNRNYFWIVTGLSIYVVVNFFVFLFYVPMMEQNRDLAANMWTVHNIAYIILCLFIAKAFYVSSTT